MRVQSDNWHPFFPNGISATMQSAATLSYAFIGYDVIANAAEECRDPSNDIPRAMISALMTCAILYVCMCMVLCGMQIYTTIDTSAPVSYAFQAQRGLQWVVGAVDMGSFAGMITGLLAGVYGQSRIYFAMSRDGLAPSMLQEAPTCALWCGAIAALLATFFDVKSLASFLNIGVLLSYAMTAASVLLINACCKKSERPMMLAAAVLSAVLAVGGAAAVCAGVGLVALMVFVYFRRGYQCGPPSTFKCPGMPVTPLIALCSNVYLMCHLSHLAWIRLLVVSLVVFFLHSGAVCLGILDPKVDRCRRVCTTIRSAGQRTGNSASHGLCGGE
ncbi:CAT9, partial [Symbiodinium microadriaticum]